MKELWAILWSHNLNAFDLTHFTNDDNLCQTEVFTWRKIESISSTGFNLFCPSILHFHIFEQHFCYVPGIEIKEATKYWRY